MDSHGRPANFLRSPWSPPVPWTQWKIAFLAYRERRLIQLERQRPAPAAQTEGRRGRGQQQQQVDPQVQVAAAPDPQPIYTWGEQNLDLYLNLGAEGQRLFAGTEDATNYDRDPQAVIATCDVLFQPRINRRIALKEFRNRKQRPSETAEEFAAELRILAKACTFVDAEGRPDLARENAEIADTIVLNCYDGELQERLLADHANSGLNALLDSMRAFESAKRDSRSLQQPERTGSSVTATAACHGSSPRNPCPGCGQTGHRYKTESCPAYKLECRRCHKRGHFAKQCKSSPNPVSSTGTSSPPQGHHPAHRPSNSVQPTSAPRGEPGARNPFHP